MADIAITSSTFSHGPVPLVLYPSLLGQHHVLQDLPCVVDIAPRQRHTCQSCSKKKSSETIFCSLLQPEKLMALAGNPKMEAWMEDDFPFQLGDFLVSMLIFRGVALSIRHTFFVGWVVYHHRKPTAFH